MKTVRVFRTVQYWIDIECEDHEDAFELAMDTDQSWWDSEIIDEGELEDPDN